ncbi:MAG: archease [Candidatus Micrarchaeaceae archaeon]
MHTILFVSEPMRAYSIKYKYLPHTAEKAFVAYGSTFSEALENAAEAMLGIMLNIRKIGSQKAKDSITIIKQRAGTKEDLVWYTLQRILEKVDERGLNAYAFKVKKHAYKKGREEIEGMLFCKQLNEDYSLLEIKAVTPYDLAVKKSAKGWLIRVVVDV